MEQILPTLVELFLKAIPTVIILVFLNFYLKAMLFKPLGKVLAERDALTRGAKETAEQSMKQAEQKSVELENKLREVRGDMYKEQEAQRRKWLDEQAAHIADARASGEKLIQVARGEIAAEAASARESLKADAAALASRIEQSLLERRA